MLNSIAEPAYVAPVEIKAVDERGQITYSAVPFRGSEACTDARWSTLSNHRLLTGATVEETYEDLHLHPPSTAFAIPSFFLSLHCVSPPSALHLLSVALIAPVTARFSTYRLCLLSPTCTAYQSLLYAQDFSFFSPLSAVGILLYPRSCSQYCCRVNGVFYPLQGGSRRGIRAGDVKRCA